MIIGNGGHFFRNCYNRRCCKNMYSDSSSQTYQSGRLLVFRCCGDTHCRKWALLQLCVDGVQILCDHRRTNAISIKFHCGDRRCGSTCLACGAVVLDYYIFYQMVFSFLVQGSHLPIDENGSLVVVCFGDIYTRHSLSNLFVHTQVNRLSVSEAPRSNGTVD